MDCADMSETALVFDRMCQCNKNYACDSITDYATRNSSGNTQSQSSQFAEPLWTDPGLKTGISVCELISTSAEKKRKKSAGRE